MRVLKPLVFAALLTPSFAFAAPGIPEQFYGTVSYSSGVSVTGATIIARMSGAVVATTVSKENGKYGVNPNLFFVPDDSGLSTGTAITFTVNGVTAAESAVFVNAALTQLNLTVPGNAFKVAPSTNTDGTKTGVQPSAVVATTSDAKLVIEMPANISVSGPAGWDGTISLPTATTTFTTPPTSSGFNAPTVVATIEIGAGDIPLTLNQAAKLTFPGQAGELVGWSQGGAFHTITAACSSATNPVLATGADCKVDVGSDLVVWTKHFSTFIIYTQTAAVVVSNGGGGGGGGGAGGGGGGGSVISTVITPVAAAATSSATINSPTGATANTTVVLASNYTFVRALAYGMRGDDVTHLQTVLIAAGLLSPPATDFFGNLTQKALKQFQANNGLSQTGALGPLTRALLNTPVKVVAPTPTTDTTVTVSKITFVSLLSRGTQTSEVLALQKLLAAKGYLSATPNGYFGPATETALKRFQTANKISATGATGPLTRAALNAN